jgi:hypothetical protein
MYELYYVQHSSASRRFYMVAKCSVFALWQGHVRWLMLGDWGLWNIYGNRVWINERDVARSGMRYDQSGLGSGGLGLLFCRNLVLGGDCRRPRVDGMAQGPKDWGIGAIRF